MSVVFVSKINLFFLVDNVSSYIFYVEGMPTGVITTLWNQVRELPLNVVSKKSL